MKVLLAFCVFFSTFSFQRSSACSMFENPNAGQTAIGHNVDWYSRFTQTRGLLALNPAGLKKSGELVGASFRAAEWTSTLASVAFSTAGVEFPVSGFNEAGLTMGILMLPQAEYPVDSDPRPAIGASQFVQYNLDTSKTINDVEASISVVRPFSKIAKMHYIACDKSSDCMVIQFVAGTAQVYRDSDLPFKILTNSMYPDSRTAAETCASTSACAATDSSLQRFVDLSKLTTTLDPARNFGVLGFQLLDAVAQTGAMATRFQILYDSSKNTVKARVFKSLHTYDVSIDFKDIKCDGNRMFMEILETGPGRTPTQWETMTENIQRDFVTKFGYPAAAVDAYGKFPFTKAVCL